MTNKRDTFLKVRDLSNDADVYIRASCVKKIEVFETFATICYTAGCVRVSLEDGMGVLALVGEVVDVSEIGE